MPRYFVVFLLLFAPGLASAVPQPPPPWDVTLRAGLTHNVTFRASFARDDGPLDVVPVVAWDLDADAAESFTGGFFTTTRAEDKRDREKLPRILRLGGPKTRLLIPQSVVTKALIDRYGEPKPTGLFAVGTVNGKTFFTWNPDNGFAFYLKAVPTDDTKHEGMALGLERAIVMSDVLDATMGNEPYHLAEVYTARTRRPGYQMLVRPVGRVQAKLGGGRVALDGLALLGYSKASVPKPPANTEPEAPKPSTEESRQRIITRYRQLAEGGATRALDATLRESMERWLAAEAPPGFGPGDEKTWYRMLIGWVLESGKVPLTREERALARHYVQTGRMEHEDNARGHVLLNALVRFGEVGAFGAGEPAALDETLLPPWVLALAKAKGIGGRAWITGHFYPRLSKHVARGVLAAYWAEDHTQNLLGIVDTNTGDLTDLFSRDLGDGSVDWVVAAARGTTESLVPATRRKLAVVNLRHWAPAENAERPGEMFCSLSGQAVFFNQFLPDGDVLVADFLELLRADLEAKEGTLGEDPDVQLQRNRLRKARLMARYGALLTSIFIGAYGPKENGMPMEMLEQFMLLGMRDGAHTLVRDAIANLVTRLHAKLGAKLLTNAKDWRPFDDKSADGLAFAERLAQDRVGFANPWTKRRWDAGHAGLRVAHAGPHLLVADGEQLVAVVPDAGCVPSIETLTDRGGSAGPLPPTTPRRTARW